MKIKRYSMLAAAVTTVSAMFAAPLTPDQALSLAMQKSAGPMRAQAQQMTLVKTCTAVNNQTPALYVFSNTDKSGFMVLAADDYARRIVLGYSDTDNFDPNNIPPRNAVVAKCCFSIGDSRCAAGPGPEVGRH